MSETGLMEFTAEFQPRHDYLIRITGLPEVTAPDGEIRLRYEASARSGAAPPPVTISSNLLARSIGPRQADAEILHRLWLADGAQFRFLLTAEARERIDLNTRVEVLDLGTR